MSALNVAVNEFFKMVQSWSSSPLVEWFLRSLALTQAILQTGWPANYQLTDGERFDFVVVGGGSAGAIVAARLAEVPSFTVLLIEAGGDPPATSVIPGLTPTLAGTEYDWNYRAYFDNGVGQAHVDGFLPYTRGKLLGGCSSNNYFIYSRGVPEDYNQWGKVAPGWNWDSALHYFKKLEGMTDPTVFETTKNARLHSTNGPVKVSRPISEPSTVAIDESRFKSYRELGIETILEINGPEIVGVSRPHFTFYEGRRSSTAEAYLRNKQRPNLYVAKHSMVTKILIDENTRRAYGVEVATSDKKMIKIFVNYEVILSAGSINSPKVLLHSGIGPAKDLYKLGIPTVTDLPVGENLHDHQLMPFIFKGKQGLQSALQNLVLASHPDTLPIPVQSGFFRLNYTDYPSYKQPHFQFFNTYIGTGASPLIYITCKLVPNLQDKLCFDEAETNVKNEIDYIFLALLHPLSRGKVSVQSRDPFEDPVIDLGYFRNDYDLFVVTEGLKFIKKLVSTTHFRKVKGSIPKLFIPGCEDIIFDTDEYWACYAKSTVSSFFHAVGTCKMGPDGVVDERLRVHNIEGLRVVDASIIPEIPSGNTNTPVMMIGEKAADMIKEDYGVL